MGNAYRGASYEQMQRPHMLCISDEMGGAANIAAGLIRGMLVCWYGRLVLLTGDRVGDLGDLGAPKLPITVLLAVPTEEVRRGAQRPSPPASVARAASRRASRKTLNHPGCML